jgi:peptidyl-prolyl cis-trans isomerase A (cyclophilin A)
LEVFETFKASKAEREAAAQAALEKELEAVTQGMTKTDSGLFYTITKEGQGEHPKAGATVAVHYRGMLLDGTVFDSSYQRNAPIEFPLGQGRVIPGWDEGIALLKKGAAARLVIPSHLAYGAQGAGGVIPPNATLIFEVELVRF